MICLCDSVALNVGAIVKVVTVEEYTKIEADEVKLGYHQGNSEEINPRGER